VGDELRNFLKEYAAESETDDVLPALRSETQGGDQDHPTWHKALRWCPKGLLGLVNSRACRGSTFICAKRTPADALEGAIMFNDSLSIEQCERLMVQLAETAFPFQCAHGRSAPRSGTGAHRSSTDVNVLFVVCRPSLVPLTGTSECSFGQGRQRDVDWGRSGSMLASLGVEGSDNVGWK